MDSCTADLMAAKVAIRSRFYRPELDMVRFFAFLAVFICHIMLSAPSYFAAHRVPAGLIRTCATIQIAGSYGVDLFFALSAYLITELLIREREERGRLDVRAFYLRRILRIWPLYFLFIAVAALVPFCNPHHQFTGRYIVAFIFLMGNWSMVFFGWPDSVVVPLWSISVEEQFYLVWAPIVARLNRRGLIGAAIIMVCIANLSRICALMLHVTADQLWANTFAHLDSIAVGILLAALLRGGTPRLSSAGRAALLTLALVAIWWRAHFSAVLAPDAIGWCETLLGWPVVAASCAAILLAFLGMSTAPMPLRYLGKISYGLYVYHLLCIWAAARLLRNAHGPLHLIARIVLAFGLTVFVAALSYTLVEKPFLRLKNRLAHVASRPV